MNRYLKAFAITLFIYISVLATFLYSVDTAIPFKQEQIKSNQEVRFTIIQESIHKAKQKKETKLIQKVIKKSKPIEKKKTIDKVVKKETVKKIKHKTKENSVTKKQIKKNKYIQENKINHEERLKKRKHTQNKYYTKIKNTINQNKSYPKIAVKRGIEGVVKIKFTISKNGELVSFKILEGKRVFKKSIIKAIQNSFPIPPPKNLLSSNKSLSLMIDYKLY